jgi:[protein-PII] uridylyltransferase
VVLRLYESALADFPEHADEFRQEVALVALGGYGRGDVAPYSDVDLLILHGRSAANVSLLARRLLHDLYDVGLELGHSVRNPRDVIRAAFKDPTLFTALAEARFIVGSDAVFGKFDRNFPRLANRRWRSMVTAIERAREEERSQYGETVYLLEPNIKRSPGGLRDLQLIRWLGFARHGQSDPDAQARMGVISKEDQRTLRRAIEFLLHVRNELHFHAGKAQDALNRPEQVRIADLFGYKGTEGVLPVEQFMQDYFRHTRGVSNILERFLVQSRPWLRLREFFAPVFSHLMEGDFRVGAKISLTEQGRRKLHRDLTEILRLADLSTLYQKRIAPAAWKEIHEAVPALPEQLSPTAASRFLSILSQPAMLGEVLHQLHEAGVLERVIPEFTHARCLLQFNEYHKYTVDEHCIRAVERATEFARERGLLGNVYRALKQKRTLHLALLIHDLGKGYLEDHSEVGLRIAELTAARLRLPPREADALKFLVHKHLLMSHLAFRRDTSDDQLIVRFAVDVGSPEVLRMLYVLTAADLAAVGPGVFNQWKAEVLADLYQRTMRHLAGDSPSAGAEERRIAISALINSNPASLGETDRHWFGAQVAALPSSFLFSMPPEHIAESLRALRGLPRGDVCTQIRYLEETDTVEYVIGTYEDITPGVFHKLTGGLSSQGLEILSADINTLADGLILDRFVVHDPDFTGPPSPERLAAVSGRLSTTLKGDQQPAFRRLWSSMKEENRKNLEQWPTRVRIDNSTSESFTILDIFASDRTGLLYTIARTLFALELSVSLAKIGTYLDQVVDVFYVTDLSGRKISSEARLEQIHARLLRAIDDEASTERLNSTTST